MFKFLEKEGAQVLVEPIGTWIMYMIHQAKQQIRDERGLDLVQKNVPKWNLKEIFGSHLNTQQRLAKLTVAEAIFKREYHRLIDALGGIAHHLTDQYELQRLGHPFYNSRAGGGEGHLEVAKNIYYSNKDLAHMVLSLKPFGCMPSTQSDGAQSAVVSTYKDMIFIPVETSGEGDVNAHSRVQMALGEAKVRAKNEIKRDPGRDGHHPRGSPRLRAGPSRNAAGHVQVRTQEGRGGSGGKLRAPRRRAHEGRKARTRDGELVRRCQVPGGVARTCSVGPRLVPQLVVKIPSRRWKAADLHNRSAQL